MANFNELSRLVLEYGYVSEGKILDKFKKKNE